MAYLLIDRPPRPGSIFVTLPKRVGRPNEEVDLHETERPQSLESFVLSTYVNNDGSNSIDDMQDAMEQYKLDMLQLQETMLILEDGPPVE